MPVSWRAKATRPTQNLVKQVKRTIAATSVLSFLSTLLEATSGRGAILTEFIGRAPTFDRIIYQHVGEPTPLSLSNDWDVCRAFSYYYGQRWVPIYLRNIPCRREEDLSAPRVFVVHSESVVSLFHLVC